MKSIMELMLAINDSYHYVYYHMDTNKFDYCPCSEIELKNISFDSEIPFHDPNNFRLPTYEEINHKEIMSFYVRECIDDKDIRKQLFNILRRHNYMAAFIEKLNELNLYDDFVNCCVEIYVQIFEEWAEDNDLDFFKK